MNAGAYTELFRACWNGSTLNTSLGMGTNTLTCGPVNATTGTFSDNVTCPNTSPTFNGSTTVVQTSATLPTAASQIGYCEHYQHTSYQFHHHKQMAGPLGPPDSKV